MFSRKTWLKAYYMMFRRWYILAMVPAANTKNFVNVCQHRNDFGLSLNGTSHGQNSCDGIGGTTKWEVIRASLQRPYNDHILTPGEMFKFCSDIITGAKYIFVPSEEIEKAEKQLVERFECCLQVKGTTNYHHFVSKW